MCFRSQGDALARHFPKMGAESALPHERFFVLLCCCSVQDVSVSTPWGLISVQYDYSSGRKLLTTSGTNATATFGPSESGGSASYTQLAQTAAAGQQQQQQQGGKGCAGGDPLAAAVRKLLEDGEGGGPSVAGSGVSEGEDLTQMGEWVGMGGWVEAWAWEGPIN
jgi:hypothetical protein